MEKNNEKTVPEEYVDMMQQYADEMEKRILEGEVIRDFVNDEGERIVVTKTSNGMYGYAVYDKGSDTPHYYVEGSTLLEDLNKKTDYSGKGLRYEGAKSMIQRNMTGLFYEYIKDPGFEALYVSIQCPPTSTIQIGQIYAGYNSQDPVALMSASFYDRKFYYAEVAEIIMEEDKPLIRVGMGTLHDDGTPAIEETIQNYFEAERYKKAFGGPYMNESETASKTEQCARNAQSIFYGMYQELGLPILEEVKPNSLISDGLQGKPVLETIESLEPPTEKPKGIK